MLDVTDLAELRATAARFGIEPAATTSTPEQELRHYFGRLSFGLSARLQTIAAAIGSRNSEITRIAESAVRQAAGEAQLCEKIFEMLFQRTVTQ